MIGLKREAKKHKRNFYVLLCSRRVRGHQRALSSLLVKHPGCEHRTSPSLCIRCSRQPIERWSVSRHRVFKCCVGKSSCSETFRLRGSFHCGAEYVNGHFTEMSFLWWRRCFANCPGCLFIVSSTFAKKKTRGGRPDGGQNKKETHHIKSDYIVSLMEQFVSQFCQQHALARLPGGRCLQPDEPSGIVYFTLDAL